jgi:hypothetical protein
VYWIFFAPSATRIQSLSGSGFGGTVLHLESLAGAGVSISYRVGHLQDPSCPALASDGIGGAEEVRKRSIISHNNSGLLRGRVLHVVTVMGRATQNR